MKIQDIVGKGVYTKSRLRPLPGMNMSHTANQLARSVKRRGIQPGTDAWFRAWFSLPRLTGKQPFR
jgi:hypothetical protein